MVDVNTIGILVASASVVVAAVSFIQQNRESRRMRQDELFMPVFSRFYETEFTKHWNNIMYNWEWKNYDDFMERYDLRANLENMASWSTVTFFFQVVGTLLKRKRIDPTLVSDLMQTATVRYWEKIEPVIKEMRKQLNFPRLVWAAEYLYSEMKRMEQLEALTTR